MYIFFLYESEQPRGVRLGYMGYITHISDEICKLIDTCGSALNKSLGSMRFIFFIFYFFFFYFIYLFFLINFIGLFYFY